MTRKNTLYLKNKVVGLYNPILSTSMNISSDKKNYPNENVSGDKDHCQNDNNQKINVLEKHIQELESALQSAREDAFQSGFEEGLATARMEAKKELTSISNEFSSIIQSLKVQYDQALERMDQPLLKLAMKVAEKIIGRELNDVDKCNDILERQIKIFLRETVDQNKITIYMNPKQIDRISSSESLKELRTASKANVNFSANNQLKPGECILETENFIIEGIFTRQLDNLEKQILEIESK
jgi:flagellar assembly protein FliH